VINETNILSSILDTPAKPEPSFQVSHLERNSGEQFDRVLQERTVFRQDKAFPAESQSFKPKNHPATEHLHNDPRPVNPNDERPDPVYKDETHSHSDEPKSKAPVNPYALPLERLARELNPGEGAPGLVDHTNSSAVDALAGLIDNHDLKAEGSPAIDTLKEFLAGLNVDSETIDQLIEALNNGDAAGVQGILNGSGHPQRSARFAPGISAGGSGPGCGNCC